MPDQEQLIQANVAQAAKAAEFSKSFELVTVKTEKSGLFKRSRSLSANEITSVISILKKPSTSAATD